MTGPQRLRTCKLLFRLLESIRNEPTLISQLVRIAMLQIGLQPVWEGLADRQWTEADLSMIESELGKLDFLAITASPCAGSGRAATFGGGLHPQGRDLRLK